MRRASRPRLDLLPLLDVFMVVMFALATIEEERAEAGAQAAEREQQIRRAVERRAEAELREAEARLQAALADDPGARRREDVLARLLAVHRVVEVEIAGRFEAEGRVVNRCCVRLDPQASAWNDCGAVPVDVAAARRWLERDDGWLAVRDDDAQPVLVIVRQDAVATYAMADKLGRVVRERFPQVHVDAGGTVTGSPMCTSLAAE